MSVFWYMLVCFLIVNVRVRKGFACTSCKREAAATKLACMLHQNLEAWESL